MRRRGILLLAVPVGFALILLTLASFSFQHSSALPSSQVTSNLAQKSLDQAEDALQSGDYATCERLVRLSLKEDAKSPEALLLLSQVCRDTGRTYDAARLLTSLMADSSIEEQHLGRAFGILKEILQANPSDVEALKGKAHFQKRTGRLMESLATAHKALELKPNDPELVALMSVIAERVAHSNHQASKPLVPQMPNARSGRIQR